jgi:hypothetical protein
MKRSIIQRRHKLVQYPIGLENVRNPGEELWFEYHCWESPKSADAELWYHSHQKVVVLGMVPNDGMDIIKQKDRYEAAATLAYRIRFADGFESDAVEDELLDSQKEFNRPDPPVQKVK